LDVEAILQNKHLEMAQRFGLSHLYAAPFDKLHSKFSAHPLQGAWARWLPSLPTQGWHWLLLPSWLLLVLLTEMH
jgi:hypothetical protein